MVFGLTYRQHNVAVHKTQNVVKLFEIGQFVNGLDFNVTWLVQ